MQRRDLLKNVVTISAMAAVSPLALANVARPRRRVRPGDTTWPSPSDWDGLNREVGGRLLKLSSPFRTCGTAQGDAGCSETLKHLNNPYYVGDQPALTQSSGWVDAWTSEPSAYAVAAATTADVVAAVNFASARNLRLVIKGGGHSYQGTSCAPDSLLVWTRSMNAVSLHEAFVAQGGEGKQRPQPAATLGAGALWIDAYDAVTTKGGRYVQGGGCTTVGVAGLIQSGGFGSFSKAYGTAAAGLIEAEIVTADGQTRIANAYTHADLFWGLKGGGGGTLGVVTRLTVRTRELPDTFGGVFGAIKAASEEAYRSLVAKMISFYQTHLFNPHWGEQLIFQADNTLRIAMAFQGLSQHQAETIWAPFLAWIHTRPEYSLPNEIRILSLPARHFWNSEFLTRHAPALIVKDDRADAPSHHFSWAGDQRQVGQFHHAYQSVWLPDTLLRLNQQSRLAEAVFASTRHWDLALHFNKGLAGAADEERVAASHTATNPEVLDAFALAIIGAESSPRFPGMPGSRPNLAEARMDASHVRKAMAALSRALPKSGSYIAESDYFKRDWQTSFWGSNYRELINVKRKYDPAGLFFAHHGVGSEDWSMDGFTRL